MKIRLATFLILLLLNTAPLSYAQQSTYDAFDIDNQDIPSDAKKDLKNSLGKLDAQIIKDLTTPEYYDNGQIKAKGKWNRLEEDGLWKYYSADGRIIKETTYKNGKRNGIERKQLPDGRITETTWGHGKKNGLKKTYVDGFLTSEYTYKNNRLHGISKEYYKNGKLRKETPYQNGKKEGLRKKYYKNGRLKSETLYKNDERVGEKKNFDEEGLLLKK